jgi:hypothetical protein
MRLRFILIIIFTSILLLSGCSNPGNPNVPPSPTVAPPGDEIMASLPGKWVGSDDASQDTETIYSRYISFTKNDDAGQACFDFQAVDAQDEGAERIAEFADTVCFEQSKAPFQVADDGWGNSGNGEIVLTNNQLRISYDQIVNADGAMWGLGFSENEYVKLSDEQINGEQEVKKLKEQELAAETDSLRLEEEERQRQEQERQQQEENLRKENVTGDLSVHIDQISDPDDYNAYKNGYKVVRYNIVNRLSRDILVRNASVMINGTEVMATGLFAVRANETKYDYATVHSSVLYGSGDGISISYSRIEDLNPTNCPTTMAPVECTFTPGIIVR